MKHIETFRGFEIFYCNPSDYPLLMKPYFVKELRFYSVSLKYCRRKIVSVIGKRPPKEERKKSTGAIAAREESRKSFAYRQAVSRAKKRGDVMTKHYWR